MKRTIVDRLVGVFNPAAETRRVQARVATSLIERGYDAAKTYATSDWVSANTGGANAEIGAAKSILDQKSHDLARNNPYAVRIQNVIVSSTVGAGIVANIKGKKSQVKKLNELWKQVTNSPLCDSEGRNNFASLQALAMRSIVESGEVIGLKEITPEAPRIKLLESDFLATKVDEGNIIQGIELDGKGRRTKYHLYKRHPGEKGATEDIVVIPASKVAHAYKQDRPGQQRGIPWATPVIETLKDLADYQYATIVGKKVAACFVGVITTNGNDGLSPADLKVKRQNELQMSPGSFKYASPGESVQFSNPPAAGGYAEFMRDGERRVAAGYGVSYERMTGDYSMVNFSSGRMGDLEFRRNVDMWRWSILIPNFCDPYFTWFLEWANLTHGIDITGVTVDWVPPAHVMIDPTKEGEALKREVRNGFKTWGQAVAEQGLDPDQVLIEISEWNKKIDDLNVTLDTDPRRMAGVGFANPKDTLPLLSDAENLKPDKANNEEESKSGNSEEASPASDESGVSGDDA